MTNSTLVRVLSMIIELIILLINFGFFFYWNRKQTCTFAEQAVQTLTEQKNISQQTYFEGDSIILWKKTSNKRNHHTLRHN